jgi:hypothetical protein
MDRNSSFNGTHRRQRKPTSARPRDARLQNKVQSTRRREAVRKCSAEQNLLGGPNDPELPCDRIEFKHARRSRRTPPRRKPARGAQIHEETAQPQAVLAASFGLKLSISIAYRDKPQVGRRNRDCNFPRRATASILSTSKPAFP